MVFDLPHSFAGLWRSLIFYTRVVYNSRENNLEAGDGDAVGGEVGGPGGRDVLGQGIHGVLAQAGLSEEAQHGHHGEASVLDLLQLQLVHVALGHAHGVEGAAGVAGGGALEGALQAQEGAGLSLGAGVLEVHDALGLHPAHQQQLSHQQSAETDGGALDGDLTGLIPHRHVQGTDVSQQGGDQDTGDTGHGKSAVHQLSLDVVGQGGGVLAQAQGVEAKVAGQRPSQVRRGSGAGQPQLALSVDDNLGAAGLGGASGNGHTRAGEGGAGGGGSSESHD
mmetsp:Transcript_34743/g.61953  ORF Transcript_34743/g.61953 Transcript_34743/m.61953 type:complete len:279 (-) Transcript_34743:85-921(-)